MSESEVAHIREQIACEYQSAQFVFEGFTSTGKHEFLTKRQENVSSQKFGAKKTDHLIESRKEAPSLPDNQCP